MEKVMKLIWAIILMSMILSTQTFAEEVVFDEVELKELKFAYSDKFWTGVEFIIIIDDVKYEFYNDSIIYEWSPNSLRKIVFRLNQSRKNLSKTCESGLVRILAASSQINVNPGTFSLECLEE
jgi:hypothetical protein